LKVHLLNGKLFFDGFADARMEDNQYCYNSIVFLTYFQISYDFNKVLSGGSET